ncbi:hypothetical protein DITRI_Ditri20bG0128500 [Diplodiscus trichospermus]
MLSNHNVIKAKSLLSTAASLAATAMVIRTIAYDFLPPQIKNYFSSSFQSLSHHFSSQLTIVIEEFRGLTLNQVFEAADIYLGSKSTIPSIQRLKIGKTEKENKLAISIDRDGIVVDVYENVEMRWKLVCTQVESIHSRETNHGDLNASLRSEVRQHELSFHKKNKDIVLSSYLPYILGKAKKFREDNKTVNLHTANYGRWDQNDIELKHPMTFKTLAMDLKLKEAVMEDLENFMNGEEYYRRIGKAWKRDTVGTSKFHRWALFMLRRSAHHYLHNDHRERLDPALLRPGRMDMHVHMSYCNASVFKQLALNYLGISDHGVFQKIERLLEEVNVTPAEVAGELMKKNSNEDDALQG